MFDNYGIAGFQLQNDQAIHGYVRKVFSDFPAFVTNGPPLLGNNIKPAFFQFKKECILIHLLQKTIAQFVLNIEKGIQNFIGQHCV